MANSPSTHLHTGLETPPHTATFSSKSPEVNTASETGGTSIDTSNGYQPPGSGFSRLPQLPNETIRGIITNSITSFTHHFLMRDDENEDSTVFWTPEWDPMSTLPLVSRGFHEMTLDVTTRIVGINIRRPDHSSYSSPLGKLRETRACMRRTEHHHTKGRATKIVLPNTSDMYHYTPFLRMYTYLYIGVKLRNAFRGGTDTGPGGNLPQLAQTARQGLWYAASTRQTEISPAYLTAYADTAIDELAEYWTLLSHFYYLASLSRTLVIWEFGEPEMRVFMLNNWLQKVEAWKEECTQSIVDVTLSNPRTPKMTDDLLQSTGIIPILQNILAPQPSLWCHNSCQSNITSRAQRLITEWQPTARRLQARPSPFSGQLRGIMSRGTDIPGLSSELPAYTKETSQMQRWGALEGGTRMMTVTPESATYALRIGALPALCPVASGLAMPSAGTESWCEDDKPTT